MSQKKSFGYYIIYALTRPLSLLPLGFHFAVGRCLGAFMEKCLKYRRDVVMINLSRSFPEKKYKELKSICSKFYAHLGKLIAETIWYGRPGINSVLADSKLVSIDNPELLGEYFDKGKPIFALTTHCGNWELYGGLRSYADPQVSKFTEKEVCSIYKKMSSRAWDEFLYQNRISPVYDKKTYDGLQESHNILRYAVSHRRDLKLYICNMDQYPYADAAKVPITFMNQQTYSMNAFPTLASKLGSAVLYISYREKEDGRYTIHFSKLCEDASKVDTEEILKKYYACLENDLREQPWNYLWTHKRWK